MDLKAYTIKRDGWFGKRLIKFDNPSLATLESFLNGNITDKETFEYYLTKLYKLKNNWSDLDSIVKADYRDYWDEEILRLNNATGDWFTFGGSEDICIYISNENKKVYMENEILDNEPVVEMLLEEFINVIEQWKAIQLGVKK